jgi:hypothetical protein
MNKITLFLCIMIVGFVNINLQAQEEDYTKNKKRPEKTTDNEETETAPDNDENEDKKFDWSRTRVGGGFGIQFGDVTSIELSPQFGYYVIKDKLLTGAGINFTYYSQRNTTYYNYNGSTYVSSPFKSVFYGGNIFTQYNIYKGLNVYGQYELINKDSYYKDERVNVSHLLLGGGYSLQLGQVAQMNIMLLYDVINSRESIYQGTFTPNLPLILKVNVGFGLGGRR